jgi:glucan biosynthesis protein
LDPRDHNKRQFVIDFSDNFAGGQPRAQVQASGKAALSDVQVFENPLSKAWRVFFSLTPDAQDTAPVDIQCWLDGAGEAVSGRTNRTGRASETWRYLWNPSSHKRATQ